MSKPSKKASEIAPYDPAKIEKKWQKKWAAQKLYRSAEDPKKPKSYILDMFPYPSGEGLHVGHPKGYIATDVVSRMKRMQGHSVLHPMGFDAFGLPAENYAIKTKTNPADSVARNVKRYKEQLELLGFDYDWSREVNTTDPNYYKWTQWIFLQMYDRGLAYESYEPVNWCPKDKTVLANEDVEDGRCERCGTPVEKKRLRQWVLKITDYADRLLKDLDAIDTDNIPHIIDKAWPPRAGKKRVERRTIHAIVRDPKTEKYLGLKWKKFPWTTFVIGGVGPGEDIVEAARREVEEETGYHDLGFVRVLGGPVKAEYFAAHKDQNRVAITSAVLFELNSDSQKELVRESHEDFDATWLDIGDIKPCAELPVWKARLGVDVEYDRNTGVPCFIDATKQSYFKEGVPVVERKAIAAIVKHWKEDKYIGLKWKKVDWQTLITGGAEGDQTQEEGAIQEIIEETGYLHPKLKRHLGKVESKFFHNPKNVNRYAKFDVMCFELRDGERRELTPEEQANHDVVWLSKEEMEDFLSPAAHIYMWQTLFLGKPSWFQDKARPLLDWPESIKEAQRNWIGRSEGAEIDFRLTMTKNKTRFVIIHGYGGSAGKNFIPWLKAELEKRGHDVETPELPNTKHPIESEQVDHVLKNCRLDENTVVIGHSLGAVVAMKALMKLKKPISGLVLVAAAMDPKHGKKHREYWEHFDFKFEYDLIRKLTGGKIAILSDSKEPQRRPYLKALSDSLEARLVETTGVEEHFCADQEPEVLKAVTPSVTVFTTRPDTLFGVTYLVLAPEHPWIEVMKPFIENKAEVDAYIGNAARESEIERTSAEKEKTGVELKGIKAVNPANNEEVPVWIADYVLPDYGTGAVMAVPAHDERDYAFAKKFGLPIRNVIAPLFVSDANDSQKKDLPEMLRNTVVCLIKHPTEDKYLFLEKKDKADYGSNAIVAVAGGIDPGENKIQASIREIKEETGYSNLEFKRDLGFSAAYRYFSKNSGQNRLALMHLLYFELKDEQQLTVSEEEKELHDTLWISKDDISRYISGRPFNRVFWGKFTESSGAFTDMGVLGNSENFDGKQSGSIMKEITAFAGGRWVTKYKLRDWVFSRQRYWGEPIPVIHCEKCGVVPVPEKDLPVKLPRVKSYEPTGTGESPLAAIGKWVNVKCPKCGGKGRRETNTMPQWAGSCWYYLRYEDPKDSKKLVDPKKERYWSPVDLYVGGAEHATRHLIYARFWHKFLNDIGAVSTIEPFKRLQSVGLIMGEDGRKMSKRFGNVINPDDIVKSYGADTLRVYEMFMGPFDQAIPWSTESIIGSRRFLERVWKLSHAASAQASSESTAAKRVVNQTIKKVTEDISGLRFNTAISALMICLNGLEKEQALAKSDLEAFLKLLAPFAPHLSEEAWLRLGNKGSIHSSEWPRYDPALVEGGEAKIIVQVGGKVRGSFMASPKASEAELGEQAKALPAIQRWLQGRTVKKIIVVPGRLINIVLTE